MAIPAGVETVTVTDGGVPVTSPDGTLLDGQFLVTGPALATVVEDDFVFGGLARRWVRAGRFDPLPLVATDASGINPSGFTYTAQFIPRYGEGWTRYFQLPKATPTVILAHILVPDPVAGTYTVLADASTLLAKSANLSDLTDAAQARDHLGLGDAATRNIGTEPGTVAAGDDPRFGAGGGGGGGGAPVRTASVRVTDDNLAGLPAAGALTIVQTSAGTKLQCSIPAGPGDRIRVVGRFMHKGSHFLDWVLLDNTGAISVYGTTESATPPTEGDPALYPSLSLSYEPGPPMFTVAANHIDATGKATVALAHQGSDGANANLVYAHVTYPFKLRLENLGPEPA